MHNLRVLLQKRYWVAGFILSTFPVMAAAPAPSQEFWDYLSEFGDDSGQVLDPLELDQALTARLDSDSADAVSSSDEQSDVASARHADMKFSHPSQHDASSSSVKGAQL